MSDACITFAPDGSGSALYTEAVNLEGIGDISIRRASEIEFCNDTGHWTVRLAGDQRVLYRHPSRQACLDWEHQYLQALEDRRHNQ